MVGVQRGHDGRGRLMANRRRRTMFGVAGAAVVSLAVGLFAGSRLLSPADAADRTDAPEASLITVPVELRTLESNVTTRADASYAGAVDMTIETSGLESPPVVTGLVPEVGANLTEATAVLEVAGRPVIALVGELPMYRSLRPGVSGPDVLQLEQTLERLGYDPGTVDEDYTASTGQAVAELYEAVGYDAPAADMQVSADLEAAEEQARMARDTVRQAEQALEEASTGPSESERVAASNAVEAAERNLAAAEKAGDAQAIAAAKDELEMAQAQQRDLLKDRDTSAQKSALDDARDSLADAEEALATAQAASGTPLPASEVVYLPSLPRRVDEVHVTRGKTVEGAVMSVSGASLVLTAQVDEATRELLKEAMPVTLDLPTGEQAAGTITSIAATKKDAESEGDEGDGEENTPQTYDVVITPAELTPEQTDSLRDSNIKITIPITSTAGDVLAVPVAAVTAGPGGESRVEVQRDGSTELVEVELGLSADGYVEVTPVEGELAAGDSVVVGR